MTKIYIILLFILSWCAQADNGVWLGLQRNTWPQTDYRKTKNDFGGWLLVTSDLNWQKKWETHPDTVPIFNETTSVKVGKKIVILSFFVNPKTNKSNEAHVLCDIKVTRPNNTISVNYKGITCIQGKLKGNPEYIHISPAIINFSGETTDPLGTWLVEVVINDVFRGTVLNLKTSFILEPNNG